jgi:hypothetical protein
MVRGSWNVQFHLPLIFRSYLVLLAPGILSTCFNRVADESITQNELSEVGSRVSIAASSAPVVARNAGASKHVLISAAVVGNPPLTDPFSPTDPYSRISRFLTILRGKNDCNQQRSCISRPDYQLRSHNRISNPHRQRSKCSISLCGY